MPTRKNNSRRIKKFSNKRKMNKRSSKKSRNKNKKKSIKRRNMRGGRKLKCSCDSVITSSNTYYENFELGDHFDIYRIRGVIKNLRAYFLNEYEKFFNPFKLTIFRCVGFCGNEKIKPLENFVRKLCIRFSGVTDVSDVSVVAEVLKEIKDELLKISSSFWRSMVKEIEIDMIKNRTTI